MVTSVVFKYYIATSMTSPATFLNAESEMQLKAEPCLTAGACGGGLPAKSHPNISWGETAIMNGKIPLQVLVPDYASKAAFVLGQVNCSMHWSGINKLTDIMYLSHMLTVQTYCFLK